VLDEPSVGLHPRDTNRLVGLLENLRDLGNTLVVVEHETGVIRRADHVVDLGPERGERGGEIVYNGPGSRLAKCRASLTAAPTRDDLDTALAILADFGARPATLPRAGGSALAR